MKRLFFLFSLLALFSFKTSEKIVEQGRASFYSSKFEGRRTASGEKFSQKLHTAAHKTLPFGTEISVRNKSNDSIVLVKINDRLPKSSKSTLDVSLAVAKKLNFVRNGYAQVEISYTSDN